MRNRPGTTANDNRPTRVLISAYACEPGRGSEPGVGWNWAVQAAKDHSVVVITRPNQAASIEAARVRGEVPESLGFEFADPPSFLVRLKMTGKGTRWFYYVWQLSCLRRARRLHRERPFDIAHHLTYASSWRPAAVAFLGIPFVWGPVGYVPFPWRLWRAASPGGVVREILRSAAHAWGRYLDPLVRLTWKRAAVILVNNRHVSAVAPRRHHGRTVLASNAGVEVGQLPPIKPGDPSTPRILMVGTVEASIKGHLLALEALARCVDLPWTATVIGDGRDVGLVRKRATELGLQDRVVFMGQISRNGVLLAMSESEILLHSALHDNAPAVVAEAMGLGMRVVCLDWGGPPLVTGPVVPAIPVDSYERTIRGLSDAISGALSGIEELDRVGRARLLAPRVAWSHKREIIRQAYSDALSRRGA